MPGEAASLVWNKGLKRCIANCSTPPRTLISQPSMDATHGKHVGGLRLRVHQPVLRIWHIQWIKELFRKRKSTEQLGVVECALRLIQIGLPLPE